MNKEIYAIAAKINDIVNKEVNSQLGDELFRDKLLNLVQTLDWHIEEAKALHQEMKGQNLSVNTIEAEGALRLALRIEEELDEYKKVFK